MELGGFEIAILAAAALATSALSAIVGMAGGITLLAVMLVFLDPLVAIPVHGAVQLVSNSSRAVIQHRRVSHRAPDRAVMPSHDISRSATISLR